LSPQTLQLQLTRNPTFTSHLTLALVPLTTPLSHTQPPHLSPLTFHSCTSHTVSANFTISSLPPKLPINPNSPDVLQIITANADYLQNYKHKKLGSTNKTDPSTSIITHGNKLIDWQPTSLKHATDPLCDRPSWQVWPASSKLPLQPTPSTTTSVPTFQTKCYPNLHKITAISKSQRHPSLGKSQLVAPSHTTLQWTLLSCTHSFYHHCTVSWSLLNKIICPPHPMCLTEIHYITFSDQHPAYAGD
jgi:hypothetical protein